MTYRRMIGYAGALAIFSVNAPAHAHPGHHGEVGFIAGMMHPLTGIDHLLTMLMVGLWAGIAFPRHGWVCPAAFLTFMIGGFFWGVTGHNFPFAETLITVSLVSLGIVLFLDLRLPLAMGVGVVSLFATGHGYAHGAELPAGSNADIFLSGFTVTSVILLTSGFMVARQAQRMNTSLLGRAVGVLATFTATSMLFQS